ncbi:MAG TPA: acyltransferase family protein [Candidatus Limnocylindrales bacterium]|nr:acyltransferase family protein [Candidatus Limnocylindrales bacterium]
MEPRRTAPGDGFRPDVEGLRGVAVLAVLLFHSNLIGPGGGFVGVDVFFVISGFLITGLLLREREKTGRIWLTRFYARRVRRLLPAAVVVLVATLIVALNVVAPLDRPGIGIDGAAAALSIANIRFALAAGDYFSVETLPSPFLHFWSLAVEEQFYIVWPALILLIARGRNAARRVGIALFAIVAVSLATSVLVTDLAPNWAFYSLPTRAWELGLGGLLAVGGPALERLPGRVVGLAGWIGLAAVVESIALFNAELPFPGWVAILPGLGTMVLLAGGSRPLGPGWLLAIPPLRWVGRISYSLYLVHWPILVLGPIALGVAADAGTSLALVGLSVLVATALWALVETPFRTGLPSLARRPRRTLSLAMSTILAVVVGAAIPSMGVAADGLVPPVPVPSEEPWPSDWPSAPPSPSDRPTPPPTPTDPTSPPSASPSPVPSPIPEPGLGNHGRLPDDVKPPLGSARGDEERLRRDGCLAFESVVEPPKCVYGAKDSNYTVALVGDSHAAHWFPALERLAKHEGWRVVTFVKVSCPFIDMRVRNVALKREYRECAAFNEATIQRLVRIQPDLTLVSVGRISTHPLLAGDDTVAAKGEALARMLGRLPGPTLLIVDTPYAGQDVPGCLSAHQRDIDACAIPHKTAFTDRLGAVEKVAAEASGAGRIDLTPRICVEDPCPVVVNGMIVFRDAGHLTATFSRSLAPALGQAIRAALPGHAAPELIDGPS